MEKKKKNRVSYEGKYKQKTYAENKSTVEEMLGIENTTKASATKGTKRVYSTFSYRPDKDGDIPQQHAKRSQTQGTSRSSRQRNQEEPNLISDSTPLDSSEGNKQDLHAFMEDLVYNEGYQPSNWAARQAVVDSDWKLHRSYIMNRILDAEATFTEDDMPTCFSCESETATMKCIDCSGSLFCHNCDKIIHRSNILHDRLKCIDGYFQFVPQEYPFPENKFNPFSCGCGSTDWTHKQHGIFIVVTIKGRFDVPRRVRLCAKCQRRESPKYELANVIHRGFWPANPDMDKSTYIFDSRVLELWRHVYRHLPGSSLSGFISALNYTSSKYGRKATLNQTVFSKAFAEYGYMESELELLKHQDPMKCPPCSIHQLSAHVDGNHKLYRYRHVPRSSKAAYHENRFITDNKVVEDHLCQIYPDPDKVTTSPKDIYCGNSKWKAARQVSSRYKSMDETGLVVLGCRHALAQKAVNMYRGELYGYSHYLHVTYLISNDVNYMFQDVMCKYWPWAKQIGIVSNLWKAAVTITKPALSVLHAKAHSWHCQICWGGRYVQGVGSGSGEDMEQAFSHMSRLGLTTRHMTDAARTDTLTDHVLFWNGRKIRSLPELLCKRFKRMQESIVSTKADIAAICEKAQVNEGVAEEWSKEVVKAAEDVHFTKKKDTNNILHEYFVAKERIKAAHALAAFLATTSEGLSATIGQHELFKAVKAQLETCDVQAEVDSLEQELPGHIRQHPNLDDTARKTAVHAVCTTIQTDIELTHNAIRQRSEASTYLADTSKQKSVFRRKNATDKKRIEAAVAKLQEVKKLLGEDTSVLNVEDITNGIFPWHRKGETNWGDKRKVADLFQFQQRLVEEEKHLLNEMKNFLYFYVKIRKDLNEEIEECQELVLRKYYPVKDSVTVLDDTERDAADDSLSTTNSKETVAALDDTERGEADDTFPSTNSEERYKLDPATEMFYTIKGLMAIKRQGLVHAEQQICQGLTYFKKATSRNGWMDMIFDSESESETEDCEEDVASAE